MLALPPLILLRRKPAVAQELTSNRLSQAPPTLDTQALTTTSLRVVMLLTAVCMVLLRFSAQPSLGESCNHNLLVATWQAPQGAGPLVFLFWFLLLCFMLFTLRASQEPSAHSKTLSSLLVPEVAALLLFLLAEVLLEAAQVLDTDGNAQVSFRELRDGILVIFRLIPRVWLLTNFTLLLSIAITGALSPLQELEWVVFAAWLLIFVQSLSLFLHHSLTRQGLLFRTNSVALALLFGFALYFFTHSCSLISMVLLRKHETAQHPPTIFQMLDHFSRAKHVFGLSCVTIAVLSVVALPVFLDGDEPFDVQERRFWLLWWRSRKKSAFAPLQHAWWLSALSRPPCSGMFSAVFRVILNVCALSGAWSCVKRDRHASRMSTGSYESSLTCCTAALASLCWFDMLAESCVWWQRLSLIISAATHVCLAGFSGDVFDGLLSPRVVELAPVFTWAFVQAFTGLTLEHRASVSVGHHGLSSMAVLEHLGELGLCEFGLIVTLGWVTVVAEIAHHPNNRDLVKPLLHKKSKSSH